MHLGGSSYYTFSAFAEIQFLVPTRYRLAKEAILQDEEARNDELRRRTVGFIKELIIREE